jgi:radical SAM superfamily enzyme YgiQ (UPF0313 family)
MGLPVRALIIDALAAGKGERKATKDAVGAGPRAVAGVLSAGGVEVRLVESEIVDQHFPMAGYDFLLVSGMSIDLPAMKNVISLWHGGPVVIGGPATTEPEKSLLRTGADIAVIGEGEETLSELLEMGLNAGTLPDIEALDKIRGVAYRRGRRVYVNALRPVMPRSVLNSFNPSVEAVSGYRLYRSARVYVEVLRGCSNYHRATIETDCADCKQCRESSLEDRYDCPLGIPPGCGYCGVPSLYGPPKSRSINMIRGEVKNLLDIGVTRVVLSAPCFLDYGRDLLVDPEPLTDPRIPEPNYSEIEALLSELTNLDQVAEKNASIMIENIKSSLVTEKAARILGDNLYGTPVSIGFETGCPDHSIQLGRPSSPSETLTAVRRLKKAGMKPYVYFIHGLPGQTEKTVEKTVNAIHRSMEEGAERVILYRFMSLPMSAFSGVPSASPSIKDPLSYRIYQEAQKANLSAKEALIGEKMRVVVAERYDRDSRYTVAYPLYHGPVILLEAQNLSEGTVLDVMLTGVASNRMVYGAI